MIQIKTQNAFSSKWHELLFEKIEKVATPPENRLAELVPRRGKKGEVNLPLESRRRLKEQEQIV